jgi:hypothetical protein
MLSDGGGGWETGLSGPMGLPLGDYGAYDRMDPRRNVFGVDHSAGGR